MPSYLWEDLALITSDEEDCITSVSIPGPAQKEMKEPDSGYVMTPGIARVCRFLEGYRRDPFSTLDFDYDSLRLKFTRGTPDQIAILKALPFLIRPGETLSYRDAAWLINKKMGDKLSKQVHHRGLARTLRHNPFLIILPCHRVIMSNGSYGGYAGGVDLKERLLDFEEAAADRRRELRFKKYAERDRLERSLKEHPSD